LWANLIRIIKKFYNFDAVNIIQVSSDEKVSIIFFDFFDIDKMHQL
jgi:hypothetical protein